MVGVTLLMPLMWTMSWGLIAYDCEGPTLNLTTISLTDVAECPRLESDYQSRKVHSQIIQRNELKLVHVYSCLVEVTRVMYYCGMHSHMSAVANGFTNYVHQIGAAECKNVHQFKALRIHQQTIGGITLNGSTSASIVSYGSLQIDGTCKGTIYHENGRTWENVVITSSIQIHTKDYMAAVKLETNEVSLMGGINCPYLEGYCLDSTYGETIWNYIQDSSCDADLSLLYEGSSSLVKSQNGQKYLVVEENGKIFALTLIKMLHLCSHEVWQTEHPKILAMIKEQGNVHPKMKLIVQNTDLMTYINSKFLYVEQSYKRALEDLYIETVHRRCLLHRELLRNRLLMALTSPIAVSSLIKQQPGVIGRILGEVLYVLQCTPKVVKLRRTERCYNQLPIDMDGKPKFVSPIYHIIQNQAEEVDCVSLTPPLYKIDNQWIGFTPQPALKSAPETLAVEGESKIIFSPIKPLGAEGIYTSEEIHKVQENLLFGIERKNIEAIVSRKISGKNTDSQGFSTINLFNKQELQQLAKSTFQQLWGWFTELGMFISGIVGIIYVINILKYLISVSLRAVALYKTLGLGWCLLSSLWGSLTTWILHRHVLTKSTEQNSSFPTIKLNDQKDSDGTNLPEHSTVSIYPTMPPSSPHWTDSQS